MKGNGQKQLDSSFTVILITDFCRKAQPSLSLLKASDLGLALMKPTHKEESPKNFHRSNPHTLSFSEGNPGATGSKHQWDPPLSLRWAWRGSEEVPKPHSERAEFS